MCNEELAAEGRAARAYGDAATQPPPVAHPPHASPPAAGDVQRTRFAFALRRALGQPVHVVWTHNRVRLASGSRRDGNWSVRLHALFAGGGEAEARLMADVLARRPRAAASGARLKVWFAQAQAREGFGREGVVRRGPLADVAVNPARPKQAAPVVSLPVTPPPVPAAPPVAWPNVGAPSVWVAPAVAAPAASPATTFAAPPPQALLVELFAELNAAYFHNGCQASIRWGRGGRATRRVRRSIQLGCYDFARREIRIHPALAQPFVPRYVVALVVYHEMLHEVFGLTQHRGRHSAHPPEFAVCEQSHPDYARARAWEAEHLGRLLRWRA